MSEDTHTYRNIILSGTLLFSALFSVINPPHLLHAFPGNTISWGITMGGSLH